MALMIAGKTISVQFPCAFSTVPRKMSGYTAGLTEAVATVDDGDGMP